MNESLVLVEGVVLSLSNSGNVAIVLDTQKLNFSCFLYTVSRSTSRMGG